MRAFVIVDAAAAQFKSGRNTRLAAQRAAGNTEPGGPEASRWFIAQGSFEPPTDTVVLDVILATGGAFDQAGQVDIEVVGSMVIQFHDCENATLTYDIDFDGDPGRNVSGVIPLERLSPDVVCEMLSQGDG